MNEELFMIKVSASSRTTAVAGSVAKAIRERERIWVQAIGAGAVNQGLKAIIVARSYLEQDELDIFCLPTFSEVMIDGQERTAIRIEVVRKDRSAPIFTA
jgi:stage V sporulation protein S